MKNLPTVRVIRRGESDPVTVNQADFDPATMTPADLPVAPTATEAAGPAPEKPPRRGRGKG